MNLLVTGANGFIGKNLVARLRSLGERSPAFVACTSNTPHDQLDSALARCDFLVHLAAVHRPREVEAFDQVNHQYLRQILGRLEQRPSPCSVLFTSSIQAGNGSPYGVSKLQGEQAVHEYGEKTGASVFIYRLPNVFGPMSQPNAHSVVATFCHNLARDLPIEIHNPAATMNLVYVDDVVDSFLANLYSRHRSADQGFVALPKEKIRTISVGELARQIREILSRKLQPEDIPLSDGFMRNLAKTYWWFAEGN